jgi:hypothetical protein
MNPANLNPTGPSSWLARLGMTLALVLILAAGIALSAVFFAVFAVLAMVWGSWFWWQTRHLRRQMREQGGNVQRADIIEVEYQVLEDPSTPEPTKVEYQVLEDPSTPEPTKPAAPRSRP